MSMQCLLMVTVGGYEIGTVYTAHMRRSVIVLPSFADLLRGNIDKGCHLLQLLSALPLLRRD
jgi:hypothetical protein